jgi:malate dehydrogenase
MCDIAIIGAGELGGALAYVLARRNLTATIRLIDDTGRIAEGKALDIMQASPLDGFATVLSGSTDLASAGGSAVIVIADTADGKEWQGENGLMLLRRLTHFASTTVFLCAGASQRDLVDRGVRELRINRERLFGSAPEALAAGARALVALAINASPQNVSLSVLGVPPAQLVIPWNDATVGGFAVTRIVNEPTLRQLQGRIAASWPPGPHALAAAAAKAIEAMLRRTDAIVSCYVGPDDSFGIRTRSAALPAQLGPGGIANVMVPSLSVTDRVALDNAMLL